MIDFNKLEVDNPMLLEIAHQHVAEAKRTALRKEDTDNPHGITLVIHERTLLMLFASAAVAGVENQQKYVSRESILEESK